MIWATLRAKESALNNTPTPTPSARLCVQTTTTTVATITPAWVRSTKSCSSSAEKAHRWRSSASTRLAPRSWTASLSTIGPARSSACSNTEPEKKPAYHPPCTDGSTYASSVYQHTAWVAVRLSANIQVLHVLDHHREGASRLDMSGSIDMDAGAHLTEELVKLEEAAGRVARLKGKAILDDARHQLAALGVAEVTATQRHGTLVETLEELEPHSYLVVIGSGASTPKRPRPTSAAISNGHAIFGAPEAVIADAIKRESIDLLVMGAHGHSPIRQFILGSTTTAMVRACPVAVLMFR